MSFLLDSDICSAYLKHGTLFHKFHQHMGRLHMSAVSVGELYTWAFRVNASPKRLQSLQDLLSIVTQLPVEHEVARTFGRIRAELFDRGAPLPDLDLMIAATAIEHGLTLVTHNVKDFANVPGLTVDDWLAP